MRPDEYVLSDTYGPVNQFYVVTTKRLLIGKIGLLGGLGQIVSTVDFSKVTRIRTWSELYYGLFDSHHNAPFMDMSLETFSGDVKISVNAFNSNPGRYRRPPSLWLNA